MTKLQYATLDFLLGRDLIPDALLRAGTRLATRGRRRREMRGGPVAVRARTAELVAHMSSGPIAEAVNTANEQHYGLPAEFFALFLGPRQKYSGCYWPERDDSLAAAEESMLALTCRRANVRDGMTILDLGCGWGALSLWLAERFDVRVLAVSNSARQRDWIEVRAKDRGLSDRIDVITADINEFDPSATYDRVISIEMFEHMRNWAELTRRIASWLTPEGQLFVQTFSHRDLAYRFQGTWAAERFFTAGVMPSHDLITRFTADMATVERWSVNGLNYARTLRAWLHRLDDNRDAAIDILRIGRTERQAKQLFGTWRLFLICTADIWSANGGKEWMISHHLLEPIHRTPDSE
ncbi:SAM-dependent methyltransferase [Nocardia sp. CA-145437]|uniref:SAM-dependent methyltransferase n=1 Tax=Nocardia sp. CA-145437 TaxID=3239980 RepID=UPI003D9821BB